MNDALPSFSSEPSSESEDTVSGGGFASAENSSTRIPMKKAPLPPSTRRLTETESAPGTGELTRKLVPQELKARTSAGIDSSGDLSTDTTPKLARRDFSDSDRERGGRKPIPDAFSPRNDDSNEDDDVPRESAPTLSKTALARISRHASVSLGKKPRGDTIRSMDTRIAEALMAGDSDLASGTTEEDAAAQEQQQQQQQAETNDQVWVWGNRGIDVVSHPVPQALPELGSKNVKQVSAGYKHMIMVLENGATYTWGVGQDGRLGHGKNSDGIDVILPLRVEGLANQNVKLVAAGGSCSVAVSADGVLYFWGWLGMEEALRIFTPSPVEGLEKQRVVSVCCGENHVILLTNDHSVMSWGLNRFGSLGQSKRDNEYVNLPKTVLVNQEFIAAGPCSGASVSIKGSVSYWGPNFKKKDKPLKKPEKITHKGRMVAVALGAQHMLMLEDNGDVYALGEGADGQLGTGNYQPQLEPVKVEFPLSREEKLRMRGMKSDGTAGATGATIMNASGTVRPAVGAAGGAGAAKPKFFGRGAAPPPGAAAAGPGGAGAGGGAPSSGASSGAAGGAGGAPIGKQIKAISAGNSSSVAVTKEGMVYVWGKIDSKGTESFLQPTLVRALDKIAIDQVSACADQFVALVGLKNERDIRYFSFNPPIVKAATLGKLVDWLLSEKVHQDPLFPYAFFASHDVFATSVDVLEELSCRYERARSSEGTKLQTRISAVLMQWIKWRPIDFRASATKQRMEDFLSKVEQGAMVRSIRKCLEDDANAQAAAIPPLFAHVTVVSSPPSPQFLKYPALEVAQQLALIDKQFFDRVKPLPELTHQNWMKSAKRDLSPNVLNFIARFNELFYFVVTDCIAHVETPTRSGRFHFWSDVHKHSVSLGNLNAAVCIASALNSVPIRKLAKRDFIVINAKERTALEDFRKLLSDRNKTGYRELLGKKIDDGDPAIPYLATMLSDLTFIEEGNKNTTADGLIHFFKFHLIGKTLQTVDDLQKRSYGSFSNDETLQTLLVGSKGLDEETCDKIADAICNGEAIGPLLSSLEANTTRSSSLGSAQAPAVGGTTASGGTGPRKGSAGSGSASSVSSDKDNTDALIGALDKEARFTVDKRLEVWNSWLSRLEKEGDEFRVVLCSSTAFSNSLESILLDPLKKFEAAVFQQLLAKFVSSTVNARALQTLLTSIAPVASVYPDIREEVIRLCVAHEFNALAEITNVATSGASSIKGAPVGFSELAEEETRRDAARQAVGKFVDGVDFESLDTQIAVLSENMMQVMAIPAIKSVVEYDTSSLDEVMRAREAQVQERIQALEGEVAGLSGGSNEEADLSSLNERMSELRERERELEEALQHLRGEIAQIQQMIDQKITSNEDNASVKQDLLAKEQSSVQMLENATQLISSYVEKNFNPRRQKLQLRMERCKNIALSKVKAFVDILEALKDALVACRDSQEEDRVIEGTRQELQPVVEKVVSAYRQAEEIFKIVAEDTCAQIEELISEVNAFFDQ